MHIAVIIICTVVIVSLLAVVVYQTVNILIWLAAWLWSIREEKVGLTKSKGIYNANGYLVPSNSDIHLDTTGSFKRFDSVDRDVKMTIASTSLSGTDWEDYIEVVDIPPQPLRPAPVPESPTLFQKEKNVLPKMIPPKQHSDDESRGKTSICPIPRPVSSINVATLSFQSSSFSASLTPPPSPSSPSLISNAARFKPTYSPSAPAIISTSPACANQDAEVLRKAFREREGSVSGSVDESDALPAVLQRAVSCDSICSDTSVVLGDLEDANITGYLCIGLEYDSELCDLVVNVLEAKELQGAIKSDNLDTYVRLFLLPDKEVTIQTRLYRGSNSPSYKERFLFTLKPRDQNRKSLLFHVYTTDMITHTLIGEGEIRLADISLRQPVTTWVTLTDTGQKGTEYGELMFSLSYLPTAERLTVVVVKARNLKFQSETVGDSFVKVYLMQHGKKINKKKTSTKKSEKSPIFNEAMIFSVPSHTLPTIQLRLTVSESPTVENTKAYAIGHVIIGAQACGRSLNHWNQMLAVLRKPVAMWHSLRK